MSESNFLQGRENVLSFLEELERELVRVRREDTKLNNPEEARHPHLMHQTQDMDDEVPAFMIEDYR